VTYEELNAELRRMLARLVDASSRNRDCHGDEMQRRQHEELMVIVYALHCILDQIEGVDAV
jgi:hypothetical protein